MKISPDLQTFKKLRKRGNLIAISAQVPADLETPVSSFLKLADSEEYSFLFESAEQEERIGRYSILGMRPSVVLQSDKGSVSKKRTSRKVSKLPGSLVDEIEKEMRHYKLANPESVHGFSGGFVGYLSYENVRHFETIRLSKKKTAGIPEGIFFLPSELVLFDHYLKSQTIVILAYVESKSDAASVYNKAVRRIEHLLGNLEEPLPAGRRKRKKSKLSISSNMTKSQYKEGVQRIKDYIKAGDCIQVVLSQRFRIDGARNDFQVYRALRSVNPSPYMFYMNFGPYRLIGSSPEMLVKKTGRVVETRPIAGTRPRGQTDAQDAAYAESLKKSPKEMAEHLMLVDLGRNDLGRVCEFNTVKVSDFARIENYSHVMHLVSDVAGRLKRGKSAFDLLKATFPAGTLSGAPKIRAMQIIDELEDEERGPYAGCVGYFGFNQDMDMCITIRTLVIHGRKVYLQAGAGIVKDSHPEREFEETRNKARALIRALEIQDKFS